MSLVLLFSILIKGIGALLEIVNQALITNTVGVTAYGEYAVYLNIIDVLFWVFFSGIIKCNAFYLSDASVSIRSYKKKYYVFYLLPVAVIALALTLALRKWQYTFVVITLFLYIVMYDSSSVTMARGHYYRSLIGEYAIGRLVNFGGILLLRLSGKMTITALLTVYFIQFAVVIVYYRIATLIGKRDAAPTTEQHIPPQKVLRLQISDAGSGLVTQAPVILQYVLAGAYYAGFVNIVVLVKRLVNFITGPTAKIFMPEFSRLYRANEPEGIRRFYSLVMQIQMLFIGMLAIPMLAFPDILLRIFSEELIDHITMFRVVSLIFLVSATLGPSTSLLDMTGRERTGNIVKLISIILMVVTWCVMYPFSPLFSLFGLCVQAAVETAAKFILAVRWFGRLPQPIWRYLLMWLPAILVGAVVMIFPVPSNIPAMILAEVAMGILMVAVFFVDPATRKMILEKLRSYRGKKSEP